MTVKQESIQIPAAEVVVIGKVLTFPEANQTLTVQGIEHHLHAPGKPFILNAVLRLEDADGIGYYGEWFVGGQINVRYNHAIYETVPRGVFYYEPLQHRHLPPMPTAAQIAGLQVGDFAPHSRGEGKVTQIVERKTAATSGSGKAYVQYVCGIDPGTLQEGEHFLPKQHVRLKHCSWTPHFVKKQQQAEEGQANG